MFDNARWSTRSRRPTPLRRYSFARSLAANALCCTACSVARWSWSRTLGCSRRSASTPAFEYCVIGTPYAAILVGYSRPERRTVRLRKVPWTCRLRSGILVGWLGGSESMRDDMSKVVTERPRQGHGNKSNKTTGPRIRRYDADREYDEPSRLPIARFRQYGYDAKEFSDLINPLKRYLRTCI